MDKKAFPVSIKRLIFLLAVLLLIGASALMPGAAAELPLAAGSPLAGISFDDRPLLLPVQRNFQMAMLTASSELGRSCGRMEAYGWRMSPSEQQRVNLIFNNTVDRLRGLGYSIEAQAPSSISKDITLFTADRPDKHFLFMWSAGEIGLVMTLCESSKPLLPTQTLPLLKTSVQPVPQDVVKSKLEIPPREEMRPAPSGPFSPIGTWVGSYTCIQGYSGAALQIANLKNGNFTGTFKFYPTPKNRYAPTGSFSVYGQYDAGSQRILVNPGKWIQHPKGYYNTVMVGSFDPTARTFSAYFQGVTGCTSFEARQTGGKNLEVKPAKHVVKKTKKKAVTPASATVPAGTAAPAAAAPASVPGGTVPVTNEPPASIILPPSTPDAPPAIAPVAPPSVTPAAPAPAGTAAPKKSGAAEQLGPTYVVADNYSSSGQWFTPMPATAPPPQVYNSVPMPAATVSRLVPSPGVNPVIQQAAVPHTVPAPDIETPFINRPPPAQQVVAPPIINQQSPMTPQPVTYNSLPQQAQMPIMVPGKGGPTQP